MILEYIPRLDLEKYKKHFHRTIVDDNIIINDLQKYVSISIHPMKNAIDVRNVSKMFPEHIVATSKMAKIKSVRIPLTNRTYVVFIETLSKTIPIIIYPAKEKTKIYSPIDDMKFEARKITPELFWCLIRHLYIDPIIESEMNIKNILKIFVDRYVKKEFKEELRKKNVLPR